MQKTMHMGHKLTKMWNNTCKGVSVAKLLWGNVYVNNRAYSHIPWVPWYSIDIYIDVKVYDDSKCITCHSSGPFYQL